MHRYPVICLKYREGFDMPCTFRVVLDIDAGILAVPLRPDTCLGWRNPSVVCASSSTNTSCGWRCPILHRYHFRERLHRGYSIFCWGLFQVPGAVLRFQGVYVFLRCQPLKWCHGLLYARLQSIAYVLPTPAACNQEDF